MSLLELCAGMQMNELREVPQSEETQQIIQQLRNPDGFTNHGTHVQCDLYIHEEHIDRLELQIARSLNTGDQLLFYESRLKETGVVKVIRVPEMEYCSWDYNTPINTLADFAMLLRKIWGAMDGSVTFPSASNALRHYLP